jgi:hypothetical protein
MFGSEDVHAANGVLSALTLLVGEDFYDAPAVLRRHLLEHVKKVAREEVVLKLRHARLLAWMKCTDVSLLDYSGWTAFCVEHSLWKGSHTRELIRFVESGLDEIILLVCHQVIPLSIGLRAVKELPRNASVYDQMGWVAEAVEQSRPKRHRSRMCEITGKLMRTVETARAIAKVLIGWTAPVAEIDRFIIQCFEEGLSEQDIIERAKAIPPRPPRLDQSPPQWEREPKPDFIGGWVEPRDQADCMAQLAFVRRRLDERRALLGMAYVHIRDNELWRDKFHGRETLEKFCSGNLEIDQRTFERYAREGRALMMHPEARTAIETGRVTCDRAQFAIAHGLAGSMEQSIDLASRLDCAEMARAEELAERSTWRMGRRSGWRTRSSRSLRARRQRTAVPWRANSRRSSRARRQRPAIRPRSSSRSTSGPSPRHETAGFEWGCVMPCTGDRARRRRRRCSYHRS